MLYIHQTKDHLSDNREEETLEIPAFLSLQIRLEILFSVLLADVSGVGGVESGIVCICYNSQE